MPIKSDSRVRLANYVCFCFIMLILHFPMVLSRGQVHLLIDSINKAIVDFNKSVSLNPNFPVAFAQKLFTDYRKLFKPKSNKNVYYFSFQIFRSLLQRFKYLIVQGCFHDRRFCEGSKKTLLASFIFSIGGGRGAVNVKYRSPICLNGLYKGFILKLLRSKINFVSRLDCS